MQARTRTHVAISSLLIVAALAIADGAPSSTSAVSIASPAGSAPNPGWHILIPKGRTGPLPGGKQLAVGPDGILYSAAPVEGWILRMSSGGAILGRWTPVEGHKVTGLAVDSHDTVYVATSDSAGIRTYSSTGRLQATWHLGPIGYAGLTIDQHGTVYAFHDTVHGPEVIVSTADGKVRSRHPTAMKRKVPRPGTSGSCPIHISGDFPAGIAVAPNGTIYDGLAVDVSKDCGKGGNSYYVIVVQKRSPDGTLLIEQNIENLPGMLPGMAIGGDGSLIVAYAAHVFKYDTRLKATSIQGGAGACGPTAYNRVDGVAADTHGNIYVADSSNGNIHKLSPSGKSLALWGGCPASTVDRPNGVAVDALGQVYLTGGSGNNGRIGKFSASGAEIAGWTVSPFTQNVQVDAAGNVYVAFYGNPFQVLEYSPAGHLIRRFPFRACGSDCNNSDRFFITLDTHGALYATDTTSSTVYELAPRRRTVTKVKGGDNGAGLMGIAADLQGNLYIAANFLGRILKLSPSGTQLASWPADEPWAIAVDRHGNVSVTSHALANVQRYSPSGKRLAVMGGRGTLPGQFTDPDAIAVDSHGNLYVADSGNSRIQKLLVSG